MPFKIIRGDIVNVKADAIVNSANPEPVAALGADADIYMAAGARRLMKARKKIGVINVGEAAFTPAFKLNAKYIIHTVGPVFKDGGSNEEEILSSCYRNSLTVAVGLKCKSIAFPLITAGNNGFPKGQALRVALDEFRDFLKQHDMEISLVVFDKKSFVLSEELFGNIKSYIDDNYIYNKKLFSNNIYHDAHSSPQTDYICLAPSISDRPVIDVDTEPSEIHLSDSVCAEYTKESKKKKSLENIINRIGEDFGEMLFRLIDERGLTDAQVYKKANIDRKLFSKIRCKKNYMPKKQTVLALVFALELNMDETVDLISRAGMALSPGSKFDLILSFCIENGIYDLFEVNSLLFEYDQPLLGE